MVGSIALKDIGNVQVALRKMFVDASHRGRAHGVAQSLLDAAMVWTRSRDVKDSPHTASTRRTAFRMAVDTKLYFLQL
ncbi:MAG TPA: GNAT family N-acetyltransferase [Alphaproteobacteria bacterium]|nr:GNAT family N-acetyltransferase [Alphaproteobacteria bacterium]